MTTDTSEKTEFVTIIGTNTHNQLGPIIYVERLDFSHVRGRIGELEIYGLIKINEEEAAKSTEKMLMYTRSKKLVNSNFSRMVSMQIIPSLHSCFKPMVMHISSHKSLICRKCSSTVK